MIKNDIYFFGDYTIHNSFARYQSDHVFYIWLEKGFKK